MQNTPNILHLDIIGLPVQRIELKPDSNINVLKQELLAKYNLNKDTPHEIYYFVESRKFHQDESVEPKHKRCMFSLKGKKGFPKEQDREGIIVKQKANDQNCWIVLWDDTQTPSSYHKSFISIIED